MANPLLDQNYGEQPADLDALVGFWGDPPSRPPSSCFVMSVAARCTVPPRPDRPPLAGLAL